MTVLLEDSCIFVVPSLATRHPHREGGLSAQAAFTSVALCHLTFRKEDLCVPHRPLKKGNVWILRYHIFLWWKLYRVQILCRWKCEGKGFLNAHQRGRERENANSSHQASLALHQPLTPTSLQSPVLLGSGFWLIYFGVLFYFFSPEFTILVSPYVESARITGGHHHTQIKSTCVYTHRHTHPLPY